MAIPQIRPEALPSEEKAVITWLLEQAVENQAELALDHFHKLLHAAAQPRHISGNSCLKLCYFVELCKNSTSQVLLDIVYSRTVCTGLFTFFVEWSEKNLHRSTRQIVDLVASLLSSHPDQDVALGMKLELLDRGMFILIGNAAQPLVKPAFKALEHLVSKKTFSVAEVIDSYKRQRPELKPMNDDQVLAALVETIFSWMLDIMPDTAPSAGRFLARIALGLRSDTSAASDDVVWSRWITTGLTSNPSCLENIKNYFLTTIFKLDKAGALRYLQSLFDSASISSERGGEFDTQAFLFLAALDVGKQCGLIVDADEQGKTKKDTMALPESLIGHLFGHSSSTVRSAAFSVLIHSTEATRPFSAAALDIFRRNMGVLYSDTDAKFRTEVLSNTRIMIERLRGSNTVLDKKIQRNAAIAKNAASGTEYEKTTINKDPAIMVDVVQRQLLFLDWFLDFLAAELVPTASYQRHITALKALYLMATIESREKTTVSAMNVAQLFNHKLVRILIDLLMNPFEDVRASATTILKLAPESIFSSPTVSEISDRHSSLLTRFLSRADVISKRTGRADYADGVARTEDIIFSLLSTENARLEYVSTIIDELEERVIFAKRDIANAVQQAPVHGLFASLRLLWEAVGFPIPTKSTPITQTTDHLHITAWRILQARIVSCCSTIWNAVEAILCDDSPEGHVLAEMEDIDAVDTKDVLSYSFRAIHESSNLLRTMLDQRHAGMTVDATIMPFEQFEQIGSLTYQQLKNLRHRGAFSTVTLTFARCCQLTQAYTAEESGGTHLLKNWYQGTIGCVNEQVSTTRRSAGIPALMTGILSAKSASITLDDAMEELINIARQMIVLSDKDETNLPQVHAMNCIKDIFKSAVLGRRAESYISKCLELAADALQSDVWACRNCGLILLRSLIDSLFGTTESKLISEAGWDGRSTRLNYERYPALPGLLLNLLRRDVTISTNKQVPQIGAIESVFPALDILRRAGAPDGSRREFYDAISVHLESKIWHVREIAARTICTLHLTEDWIDDALGLLETCSTSNNRCHGVMLAIKYTLERRRILKLDLKPECLSSIVDAMTAFDRLLPLQGESLNAISETKNTILDILLQMQRQNIVGYEDVEEDMILSYAEDPDVAEISTLQPTALQARSRAVQSLLMAALYGKAIGAVSLIDDISSRDADTACYCLQQIPGIWCIDTTSERELMQVCKLYESAFRNASAPQTQSIALENMTDVLDKYPALAQDLDFAFVTCDTYVTPDLWNAKLRFSGHSISRRGEEEDQASYDGRLTEWGHTLSLAIKSTSDFDTRYAAVLALRAFYGTLGFKSLPTSAVLSHMPALLACYDTLNDDDDEIRELAGLVASKILGMSLVSLAIKDKFLVWLADTFEQSPEFLDEVRRRVVGSVDSTETSISGRLSLAMIEDNSLFVEEEQNLYIDEVRESIVWCNLVSSREGKQWDELSNQLQQWTISSLQGLQVLTNKGDGYYGPASKPSVYAICNSVVQAASCLVRRKEAKNEETDSHLKRAIKDFYIAGVEADFHPLLLSILDQSIKQ